MQSADPTHSSAPTAPRAHRGDDSPPLRAERQLCTQRMLSARANAGNAHTLHTLRTALRQSTKCGSRLAIAARTPNSGDPRLQLWRAGSRPTRDPRPLNSLRSRALNSRARVFVYVCVCVRTRELPPCRSASRAGTRAPSLGRAGRWPQAGGSAAAGTGAPSAQVGPECAARAGTAQASAACSAADLSRGAAGAGLIGEWGRGGAGPGRRWGPACTRSRVAGALEPTGSQIPGLVQPRSQTCTSWDLLTALGSPIRETEVQRTLCWFLCRGARPRILSGVQGRPVTRGPNASGWVLPTGATCGASSTWALGRLSGIQRRPPGDV